MTEFVPIASTRQHRVIERVSPARDSYTASTSGSYTKPTIKEYVRKASEPAAEAPEDVGETPKGARVSRAPTNLTLLTSYATHMPVSIW